MASLFTALGDLADAAAVQAALAASTLDLFQNNVNVSKNSQVVDFTIATFSGYVQQAVATVSAPFLDQVNGGVSIVVPSNIFVFTPPGMGSPVTNQIYGWILRDSTGILWAAGNFQTVVQMVQAGDALPMQVLLNFVP